MPIPWTADAPSAGFGPSARQLVAAARDLAELCARHAGEHPGSTLEFYREAIAARREHDLATGELEWLESDDPDVLSFRSGAVTVVANTGAGSAASRGSRDRRERTDRRASVPGDTTVWIVAE